MNKQSNIEVPSYKKSLALQSDWSEIRGRKDVGALRSMTGMWSLEDWLVQSDKLASLGQLAAGVAHELRNPLAVISASAQFCLHRLDVNNELKEHFQTIYRNVENANRLVTNLLNFAKPTELNFKYQDINQILGDTLQLLRPQVDKPKLKFVKQFKSDLPRVRCDEKSIQQVFMDIILNALQASSEGAVITLKSRRDLKSKMVVVDIMDTGEGIPEEYIDRIFDPFFTTKDGGTGLGLSICQNIISEHKGKLSVDSKRNEGTKVTVSLPVDL
ncbi:MAG: ATP-binding protein [bacterium]